MLGDDAHARETAIHAKMFHETLCPIAASPDRLHLGLRATVPIPIVPGPPPPPMPPSPGLPPVVREHGATLTLLGGILASKVYVPHPFVHVGIPGPDTEAKARAQERAAAHRYPVPPVVIGVHARSGPPPQERIPYGPPAPPELLERAAFWARDLELTYPLVWSLLPLTLYRLGIFVALLSFELTMAVLGEYEGHEHIVIALRVLLRPWYDFARYSVLRIVHRFQGTRWWIVEPLRPWIRRMRLMVGIIPFDHEELGLRTPSLPIDLLDGLACDAWQAVEALQVFSGFKVNPDSLSVNEKIYTMEGEQRIVPNRSIAAEKAPLRILELSALTRASFLERVVLGLLKVAVVLVYTAWVFSAVYMGSPWFWTGLFVVASLSHGAQLLISFFEHQPQRVYLSYSPHALTCALNDYDHPVNRETLAQTLQQKLRRLASLPIPASSYTDIIAGTSALVYVCMTHSRLFMRRAPCWVAR